VEKVQSVALTFHLSDAQHDLPGLDRELRLRQQALDAATCGIVITDRSLAENPLIYVNPAFERITGYRPADVLGTNCRFLQGPDTDQRAVDEVRRALRACEEMQIELLNYRKDGTPFWNELFVGPVRDSAGVVTHFVGVQTEVTARKHAERELRAAWEIAENAVQVQQELVRQTTTQNELLDRRVAERTAALEQAQLEVIERLARAAEQRDDQTGLHTQRVARMSGDLARTLGLSANLASLIERAAPLHDVGKIATPDAILLKPGRLTSDELQIMQAHTTAGAVILSKSTNPLLGMAEKIARSHHERWDGSGYPDGLRGARIPLAARIVAVADVYDALTHARPYKPAWSHEEALAEIERECGRHFDPDVVAALRIVLASKLDDDRDEARASATFGNDR
jgi:putative two-component system response regulator